MSLQTDPIFRDGGNVNMGLASVTQTALSGLTAATASIHDISHNLANANRNAGSGHGYRPYSGPQLPLPLGWAYG